MRCRKVHVNVNLSISWKRSPIACMFSIGPTRLLGFVTFYAHLSFSFRSLNHSLLYLCRALNVLKLLGGISRGYMHVALPSLTLLEFTMYLAYALFRIICTDMPLSLHILLSMDKI